MAPPGYPSSLQREARLRDCTRVWIRPILPEDETRLQSLYGRLGRHTAYQRFFTVMQRLPPDWAHFLANVDYRERLALIAEVEREGAPELIAVARYEPAGEPGVAEVAFVVEDGWQNRGLGGILLHDLLGAAEANGIRSFRAWVLADNARMLGLLARHTTIARRRTESGVTELDFAARRPAPQG